MDANRFERLTEREREVLRLVREGLRSKEIAIRLGLSPLTVDDHLKSARRTLEVSSRHAAATAFVAWEQASPVSGPPPETLPDRDYTPSYRPRPSMLMEPRAAFEIGLAEPFRVAPRSPDLGRYVRDLRPSARLLAIAAVATTTVVTTTGMVMILREAGPLVVRLAHPLYRLFG